MVSRAFKSARAEQAHTGTHTIAMKAAVAQQGGRVFMAFVFEEAALGLTVEGLCVTGEMKDRSKNRIVRSLSFSVDEGERLAIVGRSGCGKTMTAMAILGLLPDNCSMTGSIRLDGTELMGLRTARRRALLGRDMVLLPQSGADFLNPSLTVRRQMAECLKRNGVRRAAREERMESLLGGLGFSDPGRVLRSYPFQLSGGMAQRVVMAMASAGAPRLVIADEPTKGVDRENVQLFLERLGRVFSGAAVLLITHDISVAAASDRLLVMRDGQAEEYGETQEVLRHPQSVHTHELICSLPHALSHVDRRLV